MTVAACNQERLGDLVREIAAFRHPAVAGSPGVPAAIAVRAEVAVPADVQHVADEAMARFGCTDVPINNAGAVRIPRSRDVFITTTDRFFVALMRWFPRLGDRLLVRAFARAGAR